jgi:amino acid transporter
MKTGVLNRVMVRLLFFDWDRGLVPLARRGLFGMRPAPASPEAVEGHLADSVRAFETAFGYAFSLWLAVAVAAVGRFALAQYGHRVGWGDDMWETVIVPYEIAWAIVYVALVGVAVWLVARSLRAGAQATEAVVGVERAEIAERAAWAAEYAANDLPYSQLLALHSPAMRGVTDGPKPDQSP